MNSSATLNGNTSLMKLVRDKKFWKITWSGEDGKYRVLLTNAARSEMQALAGLSIKRRTNVHPPHRPEGMTNELARMVSAIKEKTVKTEFLKRYHAASMRFLENEFPDVDIMLTDMIKRLTDADTAALCIQEMFKNIHKDGPETEIDNESDGKITEGNHVPQSEQEHWQQEQRKNQQRSRHQKRQRLDEPLRINPLTLPLSQASPTPMPPPTSCTNTHTHTHSAVAAPMYVYVLVPIPMHVQVQFPQATHL